VLLSIWVEGGRRVFSGEGTVASSPESVRGPNSKVTDLCLKDGKRC
jgi:hypothetical protein